MRTWWFLLVLGFVACGGKKEQPAAGSGTGSAEVKGPPGAVEIFVNDESVAKVTLEQVAKWPRLDTLVPADDRRLGTWVTVYLKGAAPKAAELAQPSSSYPNMIPALFPGEGNTVSFGMFDPVEHMKKGKPAIHHDALREIRIKMSKEGRGGDHQGGTGGAMDPSQLKISLHTPTGDKELSGEQILAIPLESMPGNDDAKGWPLTKLLEAGGITKYETLVLTDAAGLSLNIDKKDFDDKTTIPFVKLNKQGALRFRMLKKQGDGWQATGDLRALSSIKVTK